jgi:hypothetical protein
MTIHDMRSRMPLAEMLGWIAYFNEAVPGEQPLDLATASPEQLGRMFG